MRVVGGGTLHGPSGSGGGRASRQLSTETSGWRVRREGCRCYSIARGDLQHSGSLAGRAWLARSRQQVRVAVVFIRDDSLALRLAFALGDLGRGRLGPGGSNPLGGWTRELSTRASCSTSPRSSAFKRLRDDLQITGGSHVDGPTRASALGELRRKTSEAGTRETRFGLVASPVSSDEATRSVT